MHDNTPLTWRYALQRSASDGMIRLDQSANRREGDQVTTMTLAERIKTDVCDESYGISDLIVALNRPANRPNDWQGRPYSVWRSEERRYWQLDAWLRLISESPLGASHHTSRTWDWTSTMNGGRVKLTPSVMVAINAVTLAPFMMFRDVGPNDTHGGRHHSRVTRPSPTRIGIAFPDWAVITDASPSTVARRPAIKRSEHVNSHVAQVARTVCKCGETHHG